ncbi:hypothetical protein [Rhodovulum sp. MB263]|uniref:hypothetical protein n=1 Tax=Rhodovulum sp. (strain MB263) TaxID=308754 RepID=UPI0012DB0380|nr:hypothetical protein [Rhodovulum sp. MB263]
MTNAQTSELFIAILGGLIGGVVAPIVLEEYRTWKRERKWAAPRKKKLSELLNRQNFRTLEMLCLVSGTTPEECRTLLVELGARGSLLKGGKEGWTLHPIGSFEEKTSPDEKYDLSAEVRRR